MSNAGSCATDENATIIITLRVSPSEWVALRALAEQNDQRLSVFIRSAINRAADTRLLDDRSAR